MDGSENGNKKGLTHAPEEMSELKDITLNKKFIKGKGTVKDIVNFKEIYIQNLIKKNKLNKKIKAVVACGNGTAGIFAPKILKGIGCEIIELDCDLNWSFPKYNPNPEDLRMLEEISKAVKLNKADIGFGFDGDGDRVGVIDNNGEEIFSDKIGLLIARSLSKKNNNSKFIVDVKSTGLFQSDKVLKENNCTTVYWKTGHSHIKRKVNEEKALAGFEKSGHFFFNSPIGYGYDDGINSAIQVCSMLDVENKKMSEIVKELPTTFQSPTMAPYCRDEEKYSVVEDMVQKIKKLKSEKSKIDGLDIKNIITVNGIRFSLSDGSWGLIRASSNKPSLVIVVESPTSTERKKIIFDFIDGLLQKTGKIGEYDQKNLNYNCLMVEEKYKVVEVTSNSEWDNFLLKTENKNIYSSSEFINNSKVSSKKYFIKKKDEIFASFHLFLKENTIIIGDRIYSPLNFKLFEKTKFI